MRAVDAMNVELEAVELNDTKYSQHTHTQTATMLKVDYSHFLQAQLQVLLSFSYRVMIC